MSGSTTPGAVLPVREMLADLLLENGAKAGALREYEAVSRTAPRRFNATAGAARAADEAGDKAKARAYAMQLLEIGCVVEIDRPNLFQPKFQPKRALIKQLGRLISTNWSNGFIFFKRPLLGFECSKVGRLEGNLRP
jgi:hypothetical protein